MKSKDNLKCECWQMLNDAVILNMREAPCTQPKGHIVFLTRDAIIVKFWANADV